MVIQTDPMRESYIFGSNSGDRIHSLVDIN